MRWRNREVPTFAGSAGSGVGPAAKPAVVEYLEAVDADGNVVATITKAVSGTVTFDVSGAEANVDIESGTIELSPTDTSSGSFQPIAVDLNMDSAAGRDTSCYKAPIMGNIIGDALTKLGNILGGLIGKYSITGANASTYPKGAVIGEIGDGVEDADGAFVAVLGGDSGQTNARAAYTVDNQNSTPGSGFDYGIDLQGVDHDSYGAVAYVKCVARFTNDVCWLIGSGAPTSGASGTGDNFAGKGSRYTDYTNANEYIQTGVITSPDWKLVVRES